MTQEEVDFVEKKSSRPEPCDPVPLLLDHIADETSMYKWPDKLVEMFFSPPPLAPTTARRRPRWAGAIHLPYLQDSLSRTRPDSFSLSRFIPILVQNGIF